LRLSRAIDGRKYTITNLNQLGRNIRNRLAALGISGCDFTLILNTHGPVLLKIRGTRIAIGRGMAEKINVRESDE
jgi:Fe2+ transport system protein FeoA